MKMPFQLSPSSAFSRTACFIAAIAIIIASLFGCGGNDANPQATPSYASVLRPQVKAVLDATLAPGAVVLVRSRQGNWTEAFGTRSKDGKEAIGVDDHFRVGSITKTWTGTVILQLVQEGRLKLSDPISAYISGVPNGDNITIEQLLNMRSGLFSYTADREFLQTLDNFPHKVFTVAELLRIAFGHPPLFKPGEDYNYSNTNTVLLGQVIEKLTKMSAAEAFNIRLFQPLGLTETFQPPAENTSLPAPYARGYHYGAIVTESDTDEGAVQTAIQPAVAGSATLLVDASDWNTSWGDTAGMGISTASELALYVERMIGGGYLDKDLQKRRLESCIATNPADPDPNALHYGWGIGRTGTFYGHTGELPGYNTFMVHDPVAKTTVVVWTSMSAGPGGRLPAVEIGGLIVAELSKP